MLNDLSNRPLINWENEGTSVKVDDPHNFSQTIIPKYFKHKNIPSFVRQLNLYGFKKTRQDPNKLEFTHHSFREGRPDLLIKCQTKRKNTEAKKQKFGSSSSSSSSANYSTHIAPDAAPEDFATQREALDKLLKDMAAVHQRQAELNDKVAQLQQQNAQLKDANIMLQAQASESNQQQIQTRGKLKQTFHFMLQLWEQFKSDGGRLGGGSNNSSSRPKPRLPFIDMQRRPVIQAIEDHRSLDKARPQASSSALSARLASAMRASGHKTITTPRSLSRTTSEVQDVVGQPSSSQQPRPLKRLSSRESSFFSNPGTAAATPYDDMEPTLDLLGLMSEPLPLHVHTKASSNGSSSGSSSSSIDTSMAAPASHPFPRSLSRATRQQSFITDLPLGGLSGPNNEYHKTESEMNLLQNDHKELNGRLHHLQRGISDVLGADSFQELLGATPLFTDPVDDDVEEEDAEKEEDKKQRKKTRGSSSGSSSGSNSGSNSMAELKRRQLHSNSNVGVGMKLKIRIMEDGAPMIYSAIIKE